MQRQEIEKMILDAEEALKGRFARVEETAYKNQRRVLDAFKRANVSARHFAQTTGYGYDDIGRDTLSDLFRELLGTESAIVRPQIASGTHALALCLLGVLRPGDTMISGAGKPYDTLEEIIGIEGSAPGSLKEYGVSYKQIELLEDGTLDIDGILGAMDKSVKLILLQRSRGYAWRPSLSLTDIESAASAIHAKDPNVCVMVDNCYGEFTDISEPGHAGADLMAGSLIKNAGGGIAPTGGYVAGRARFVEMAANRLTSPGIGAEVGSYEGGYRAFYQGLFLAPHTVSQALKGAILCAYVFEKLGFAVEPAHNDLRSDIIQAIRFDNEDKLIRFCQAIQANSPIDSVVVPEPYKMPGYQHPVIMAAGTFVFGASIELSADAPIIPPYIAYLQGALTYEHAKIALEGAIESVI